MISDHWKTLACCNFRYQQLSLLTYPPLQRHSLRIILHLLRQRWTGRRLPTSSISLRHFQQRHRLHLHHHRPSTPRQVLQRTPLVRCSHHHFMKLTSPYLYWIHRYPPAHFYQLSQEFSLTTPVVCGRCCADCHDLLVLLRTLYTPLELYPM